MAMYSTIINGIEFNLLHPEELKRMTADYLEANFRHNLNWTTVKALDRLRTFKPEYFKSEMLKTVSQKQFIKFWSWFH